MKPIAVLGVGPAGLMAAHAVALAGRPVALISQPDASGNVKKSVLGGAQFLHAPIPMVNDPDQPDAVITYRVEGTVDGYRSKIYGSEPVPFVSMEGLADGQEQKAWNLRDTYDRLWSLLSADKATMMELDAKTIQEFLDDRTFDHIISSIPAPALCQARAGLVFKNHQFTSQQANIWPDCVLASLPDNTVVYNGTPDTSWYRTSKLWQIGGTEWSNLAPKPVYASPMIKVHKPLHTTCDCFAGEVLRVGRFGEWKKGVLTHHAYAKAWEFM